MKGREGESSWESSGRGNTKIPTTTKDHDEVIIFCSLKLDTGKEWVTWKAIKSLWWWNCSGTTTASASSIRCTLLIGTVNAQSGLQADGYGQWRTMYIAQGISCHGCKCNCGYERKCTSFHCTIPHILCGWRVWTCAHTCALHSQPDSSADCEGYMRSFSLVGHEGHMNMPHHHLQRAHALWWSACSWTHHDAMWCHDVTSALRQKVPLEYP